METLQKKKKRNDLVFYWDNKNQAESKANGEEIGIEMPGFSKDEISVKIVHGMMNITAQKKHESKKQGKNFYSHSISQSSMQRSFSLPEGFDAKSVEIKIEDGVIRIVKKR